MIKKIELTEQTIEEFQRRFSAPGSGKILTVSAKLTEGVSLTIVTHLDEEIINIQESGVYYPRSNISSEKNRPAPVTGEVMSTDYHYFIDGLLIELNSEREMKGEIALQELVILYDDME